MTLLLGIALTLIIFGVIVFVHELGHFLAARLTGMKVEEFGMGIPPKASDIFTDKKGTIYSLNWLPIGGFVRIKGEDALTEGGNDSDAFSMKPWWARTLVLLAGVGMNFLLAYFIFVVAFIAGATPLAPNMIIETEANSFFLPRLETALASGYITQSGGLILYSLTGSVAEMAGIGQEERVVSVNGEKVMTYQVFSSIVEKSNGVELELMTKSGGIHRVTVMPVNGKIGVYVSYEGLEIVRDWKQSFSLTDSLWMGGRELGQMTIFTWDALSDMLEKLFYPKIPEEREQAKEMVSGPIGMGKLFVSIVEYHIPISTIWIIIALISFNLGFFNLLPLPALDGGRWVTTTIRALSSIFQPRWKDPLQRIEHSVHGVGFIFLLVLSIIVAYMDISRFF